MRLLAFALAIILTVACLTACGGGDEDEGAPAAAEPAAAEEGTPAPAASPSEEGTPAATAAPSEEGLTPGSLDALDSYRYSTKMELKGFQTLLTESLGGLPGTEPTDLPETIKMEMSGAFVAPDKAEARISISGVDDELAMTVIGDQQWLEFGELAFGPTAFEGDLSDVNLADAMWGGFSEEAGGLTCTSEKKETVNDVASRYCAIDQATFEELSSLFGGTEDELEDIEELSLEMWLAEDGDWPVRLRVHVVGKDEEGQEFEAKLEMDITDVDKEIDIKPPS
jgi:hypothetical protein